MKKKLNTLICICMMVNVFCQSTINLEDWKGLKWRNIGPAGMSGRVTAIDVDLSDDKRIFLGAASGGVWLSENSGISFKPIFDEQNCLAIGSIKINQKNPSEIWVGTGEGNPRNSLNTGNGIYKSIDGGKTWKNMGLANTKTIHRIIIHRDNPEVVFAASLGSPWGPNDDRGVFKTTDGGKTWRKVLYVNNLTGAADMVVDPVNPNKMIVNMWEHQRQPWFFTSGGKGSGMYITYDGGENWKKMTNEDGLPKGDMGRVGLAFSQSKPSVVYALVEAKENGLYRSDDGGNKWKLVTTKNIGGRPFYYSEIYVDPKNENRIYNVHTYLSKSEDGGNTFKDIADYGNNVHPDHHALWIHPNNPDFIIDGNDGGAAISRDQGNTWTFIRNLPVGQFYHLNVDNDFPYNVYGGMQDNGSWVGPSSVFKPGGIKNTDYQELYFGDGFDVLPYSKDSRYGYAMSQGGNVGMYDRETGNTRFIKPVHPNNLFLRYNWNAALAQDPFNADAIYYGSQFVHYSADKGDNWSILSPDLTTNDTSKLKQHLTGGLTLDATGAENHCTILAIAPSPKDKNVIWVGTDDGNLQLTTDNGKTWSNLTSKMTGVRLGSWIPQIEVSRTNPGEAFIVVNDYRRNDFSAMAYHTADYGKTFTRIADNSQVKSFVVSILQDTEEPNLLFLGTDGGLYLSFNKGKNWQLVNKGMPQTQIADMKIQERERDLVISTFGRAMWVLDDITPLREYAKSSAFTSSDLKLMSTTPDAYQVSYKSYEGERFFGQSDFSGDNDGGGFASIYVWSKPIPKDAPDSGSDKGDKAKLFVLSDSGDTIRKKSMKLAGGLEKITWNTEIDGIRQLSKSDPDKSADLPPGPKVLPGKYKVVVVSKGKKDSTYVVVKSDPRVQSTMEQLKTKQASIKEFVGVRDEANKAYEKLKEARKQLKAIQAIADIQEDSIKANIEKWSKPIKSEMDSIDNLIFVPEDAKGIVFDDDKWSSVISAPNFYLSSSAAGATTNSQAAVNDAKNKVKSISNVINAFYSKSWAGYKAKVLAMPLKWFKE